jgi:hypothetical protein
VAARGGDLVAARGLLGGSSRTWPRWRREEAAWVAGGVRRVIACASERLGWGK